MMEKDLSIQTEAVEIRVVKVGGQKMTLATFKQIPEFSFNDGDQVLGWVSPEFFPVVVIDNGRRFKIDDMCWLLFVGDGVLSRDAFKVEDLPDRWQQIYIAT